MRSRARSVASFRCRYDPDRGLGVEATSVDTRNMKLRKLQRRADRAHLERIERHSEAMIALARASEVTDPERLAA